MISGVGGSLPEVTEADDGKVLTVVNGQWNKAENSSDKGYECIEIPEQILFSERGGLA